MKALRRWLSVAGVFLTMQAAAVRAEPAATPDWRLIQKVGDVEVYTRSVPGQSTRSLKGAGIIDAPVARIAQVLLDCRRAMQWVDSLAESRVVAMMAPDEYVEYNRVSMPLIVEDREFLTHVRMSADTANKRVTIQSEPTEHPSVPKRRKYTRGTLQGLYILETAGEGKTRVTVEVVSDPKGWIPGWLVDFFQKDWPRLTIEGIRSEASMPREPPVEFKPFLEKISF